MGMYPLKIWLRLVVAFLCLESLPAIAQEYPTGLVINPVATRNIPQQARLIDADYLNLPKSYSLESYAPTAGDQGKFGTCTGFATAYHMRTIMHVKSLRDANITINPNDHIFSPSFIYEQIKNPADANCKMGASAEEALETMELYGAAKLKTQPYSCGTPIHPDSWTESASFKILSYQTLFGDDNLDEQYKILAVKKAIAEGNPCLMSFRVAKSFHRLKTDVWTESSSDKSAFGTENYHAMCVIGFDDTKYGGAFRIINSWGTGWGNKGLVWIPYADFIKYTRYAYTAYAFPAKPKIDPGPIEPVIPVAELKGSIYFKQNTGEQMETVRMQSNSEQGNEVFYKMKATYSSGTRFRFYMNSNTAAYVYAFATDNTGKINQIFPFNAGISPLLGKNSTVAFPAEDKVIRMDETTGSDYLLILYAKKPLNITEIMNGMNANTGTLLARARKALGNELVQSSQVSYTTDKIEFSLKENTIGSVVPMFIEIPHR